MANPLKTHLTQEERQELETARDTHAKPYMRERCAAILKIADGQSGYYPINLESSISALL